MINHVYALKWKNLPLQGVSGAFRGTWNGHKSDIFFLNPQLPKL